MSEEQLKAFLEKVKGDISLQEKLKAATDVDAVLSIAKESGFSVSADDLTKVQSEIEDKELENSRGAGTATQQPVIKELYCIIKLSFWTGRSTGCDFLY